MDNYAWKWLSVDEAHSNKTMAEVQLSVTSNNTKSTMTISMIKLLLKQFFQMELESYEQACVKFVG